MKKWLTRSGCVLIFLMISCGTTGKGILYFEPSIERNDVSIRKVAIVPNRLPLNLQNPEEWRLYNWSVAAEEFQKRGFQVVDYHTSVSAFNKSGLPVEDTPSSRDKYAALAGELGVDAVIVPYYGTFASAKNVLYLANSFSFVSVATFQIFLAKQNDFFARIDITGKNYYTTGIGAFLGTALTLSASLFKTEHDYGYYSYSESNEVLQYAGYGVMGLGTLADLVNSLRSSESRWRSAFKKGIVKGLDFFFLAYPSPR